MRPTRLGRRRVSSLAVLGVAVSVLAANVPPVTDTEPARLDAGDHPGR